MADTDEALSAARRLEQALERIAGAQSAMGAATPERQPDPRVTAKLDNLIRALRTALDQ